MSDDLDSYKAFVDKLTPFIEECFKVGDLRGLEGPESDADSILFSKLNADDHEKINRLFRHAESRGAFRLLERLEELVTSGELKLFWQGRELPSEAYGYDLASDWINRCEGDPWPDERRCHVHEERLQVELVPIVYGLIRHSMDYSRDCKALFPFANAVVEGGCFAGAQRFRRQVYCAGCRRALARWAAETGIKAGLPNDVDAFLERYKS